MTLKGFSFNPLINGESAAARSLTIFLTTRFICFNPLINGESAAARQKAPDCARAIRCNVSIPSLTGSQLQRHLYGCADRWDSTRFNPLINGESAAAKVIMAALAAAGLVGFNPLINGESAAACAVLRQRG